MSFSRYSVKNEVDGKYSIKYEEGGKTELLEIKKGSIILRTNDGTELKVSNNEIVIKMDNTTLKISSGGLTLNGRPLVFADAISELLKTAQLFMTPPGTTGGPTIGSAAMLADLGTRSTLSYPSEGSLKTS